MKNYDRLSVHGLKTATFARSYPLRSRDTTVKPWCSAVAAMREDIEGRTGASAGNGPNSSVWAVGNNGTLIRWSGPMWAR